MLQPIDTRNEKADSFAKKASDVLFYEPEPSLPVSFAVLHGIINQTKCLGNTYDHLIQSDKPGTVFHYT